MKTSLRNSVPGLIAVAALFAVATLSGDAHAGRQVNNNTRTSVNKNVNVNNNVNRNTNVNVNSRKNVDIDVDVDRGFHPVGTAIAVGATVAVTSAIIGSTVYALPPACMPVQIGNMLYQQCGGAWYQPQYMGSSVQYIVVNPPR